MHRLEYAEVFEDDQVVARERERIALDQSIAMMERAQSAHSAPIDRTKAVYFTNKLWTILIEDLANPDNGLAKELRAQIISIGIWILRELESISNDRSRPFTDVIEVSKAIRNGIL